MQGRPETPPPPFPSAPIGFAVRTKSLSDLAIAFPFALDRSPSTRPFEGRRVSMVGRTDRVLARMPPCP